MYRFYLGTMGRKTRIKASAVLALAADTPVLVRIEAGSQPGEFRLWHWCEIQAGDPAFRDAISQLVATGE